MNAKLVVDGKDVDLNEFVERILSGTVAGAAMSLRDVSKDWKKIVIEVTR